MRSFSALAHRRPSAAIWGSAALGIIQVAGSVALQHHQAGVRPIDAIGVVLLLSGPILLLARNRAPRAIVLVVAATTLAYYSIGYPAGPGFLSLVVALFTVTFVGRRWVGLATSAIAVGGYVGIRRLVDPAGPPTVGETIGISTWLLVIFVLAEVARIRRLQGVQASRARAQEDLQRVTDERLRIARELHDILAHHVSLINVQAGVALHLLDEQPEAARPALAAIKDASRLVLQELRSTLGVLRGADGSGSRMPAPGLDQLHALVDAVNASGQPVGIVIEGQQRAVPPSVGLAAYRITQEALTNVHKHAEQATALVRLTYRSSELMVEVTDDGQGPSVPTPASITGGNGIVGMRERVLALGGTFQAGGRPEGGFMISTRLPYRVSVSEAHTRSGSPLSGVPSSAGDDHFDHGVAGR